MQRNLVIIVGLTLTAVCLLLYVFEPPFISRVSHVTYDMMLRHAAVPPQSDRIALVDIDEKSLAQCKQWPWPRFMLAKLTRKLFEANVAVVAFDIVFPEEDRTSPEVVRRMFKDDFNLDVQLQGLPPELMSFDRMFGEALAGGKTVLGCYMHETDQVVTNRGWQEDPHYRGYFYTKGTGTGDDYKNLFQADGITISIPALNDNAGNSAFFNTIPDYDNIIRGNPLIWSMGPERIYPSLALEALRMYRDVPQVGVEYDRDGVALVRLRELNIPTDFAGRLVVNFRTPLPQTVLSSSFRSFPSYSAVDILNGQVDPNALSNRIIFVGTSAVGLKDIRATPLTPEFAGVEVHATIVDNILAGDMLLNPRWGKNVNVLAIVIIGIFLTFLIYRGAAWLSFLATALVILATIYGSMTLMERLHFVFVPSPIVLTVMIIYPVLTMLKYWQEEFQRRWVRNLFGTMVSHDVLSYLERHPQRVSLSGVKAEATMFFSDVAGFTSISEALSPGQLSELLNRYLSPMTHIVMNHGGYVDKYEGDLIMAVWGVPFPMADHAEHACLAALEQMETLEAMQPFLVQQFGHAIHVRMGINSGTVTAGNMGSDRRFQYTVMGDAVNQASRFESANKDYRTGIMLGETTYLAAKNVIEGRLLDLLVPKGRRQPIRVYELLGRKGEVAAARLDLVKMYEQALEIHWKQEWDQALALLQKALQMDPNDGPSLNLRQRIHHYQQNPPPAEWTGEYFRLTKD